MSASTLTEDQLSDVFAALANTTRRAILQRLAHGAATVNQLAEPFNLSLPGISKHLKVLRHAGLIERGQRGQFRPCSLNPRPLESASNWADDTRSLWASRFDQMDAVLAQLQTQST